MKKNILLSILFFVFGFFSHALFFPEFLAGGFTDVSQVVIPVAAPSETPQGPRDLTTKIYFDGTRFSRHAITIEAGTYMMIINASKDKKMWLISTEPKLATPRGYGESESVRHLMETKGQFAVADKNNPQEKLIINVK